MNTQVVLLSFFTLLATGSSFRLPSRTNNRQDELSQVRPSTRRHHSRSPRLFDEFLETIVTSGTIPHMDELSFGTANNTRATPAPITNRNAVHSSLRNYIQQNRQRQISDELESQLEQANTRLQERDPVQTLLASGDQLISNVGERSNRRDIGNVNFNDFLESSNNMPRGECCTCCDLGNLAGDKGFLCDSQFYADRVQLSRASNRVHHRRLTGTYFQDLRPTENGNHLLEEFHQCVLNRADAQQFEECCEEKYSMYEDRVQRWQSFGRHITQ